MSDSIEGGGGVTRTARAKVNLALHVRGRRPDGYHEIETLFAFAEDGDRVTVAPADTLTLAVTGPFAPGLTGDADNLVMRAAAALREAAGVTAGARIVLDKRLPVAAGIGGGSADAAAALHALAALWCVEDAAVPASIAPALGADVPACLDGSIRFGSGVGDRLASVARRDIAGTPILLVNSGHPCSTGPVFRGWDAVDRGPLNAERWEQGRNDLTASAVALVPAIGDVLALLAAQRGAAVARMSGSGATCFATFADIGDRDAANGAVRAAMPGAWTLASRIAA